MQLRDAKNEPGTEQKAVKCGVDTRGEEEQEAQMERTDQRPSKRGC